MKASRLAADPAAPDMPAAPEVWVEVCSLDDITPDTDALARRRLTARSFDLRHRDLTRHHFGEAAALH